MSCYYRLMKKIEMTLNQLFNVKEVKETSKPNKLKMFANKNSINLAYHRVNSFHMKLRSGRDSYDRLQDLNYIINDHIMNYVNAVNGYKDEDDYMEDPLYEELWQYSEDYFNTYTGTTD